jgi:DNA-binding transcriptional regulator YiaG
MPKRIPLDWEDLERELHAAGVSPEEIAAGARRLLAQARGHQLAETRRQVGLGQKQIAAAMGVSIARVSQIEHGQGHLLRAHSPLRRSPRRPAGPRR